MKQQANPADYIPRARSTYDEFRKRHPFRMRWEYFKLTVSEWWCERWSKQLPESDYWQRYKELHAGRSILLHARDRYLSTNPTWLLLWKKILEIEREIKEVKQ